MIFSKKTETETDHPPLADAIEQYKAAAGQLFTAPSKKLSVYEKGAWLLHDKTGLIAIVSDDSVLFGANIRGAMQQVAEGWAE